MGRGGKQEPHTGKQEANGRNQEAPGSKPEPRLGTKKDARPGRVRKRQRANSTNQHNWWKKLSLPRRGKKDSLLSPAPLSPSQQSNLARRREKLHKAVSAPRTARSKHMAVADWDFSRARATVTQPRGSSLASMGDFSDGVQRLLPEEALFLVDRGALDLRMGGRPASLQRAWATLMRAGGALKVEEYLAFAHLRRAGYVVRRAEGAVAERGEGRMRVALSAWRVGAYRRKETPRPLFHVAVATYDAATPRIREVKRLLDGVGKTRVRMAVIDRGVVVFTDLANNATPLSERFRKRFVGMGEKEEGVEEGGDADGGGTSDQQAGEAPLADVVDAKMETGLSDGNA